MASRSKNDAGKASPETVVTHSGRTPGDHFGFVSTPVFHGSTILFKTLAELDDYGATYRYGRNDNPTARGFADSITALEQAEGTVLAPSGLSAITTALLAVLDAGDELLVTDSVYEPTRVFCTEVLARMGITTRFYDPKLGRDIAALFNDKTKAIFVEGPGSLTFEIQDLPGIVDAARTRDLIVLVDNTWATPLFHKPLTLGADIVVHSATKMFGGHSDLMLGTASATARTWPKLKRTHRRLGAHAAPDDVFLAARGLRTLAIRMKELEARALDLARWLAAQPAVRRVLHPALPGHAGHALWQRDFTGSGSLFAVELEPAPRSAIAAMVDSLELFGMGYSWGGFESLWLPFDPHSIRTAVPWTADGNMVRVHVGFEDMNDLKADLTAGLDRYRAANPWFRNGVAAVPADPSAT